MKLILVLSISLILVACASSKEDQPLLNSRNGSSPPSALDRASQDLRQSAKFSRLSRAIRFEYGSTALNAENKRALDEIAVEMNRSTNSYNKVRVAGFSDTIGNANRNQQVSLERAENVRSYLISQGVPARKLEAVGMGSEYANKSARLTKTQASEDRRVELEIVE